MQHLAQPLQSLRQMLFPPEFRIRRPIFPQDVRDQLAKLIDRLATQKVTLPAAPPPDAERLRMLTEIGIGLWRMRLTMVPRGILLQGRPASAELVTPFNRLLSAWDSLAKNGLEIQDHTGDPYRSGQAIDVEAYEPTPGLKEETVVDTIEPSIYLNGKLIRRGKVIVGRPE